LWLTIPRLSLVKKGHLFGCLNYYLVIALPEPGICVLSLVFSYFYFS